MPGLPPNVRLANEIAVHFTHVPAERAATEIAAHMRSFWDPRMLADLLSHVDSGSADLDPLAHRAAALLREPGRVTRRQDSPATPLSPPDGRRPDC